MWSNVVFAAHQLLLGDVHSVNLDGCAIYYVYIYHLPLGWPENLSAAFIKMVYQAGE